MSELQHFKIVGDHAEYRPAGKVPLSEAVALVTSAIAFAREQGVRKLLVVTSQLTGFEPPSIATRYFFVKDWAFAAHGAVTIAMVARPEMIDPGKFGVTVAANMGVSANVFASEEPALAWLQNQ